MKWNRVRLLFSRNRSQAYPWKRWQMKALLREKYWTELIPWINVRNNVEGLLWEIHLFSSSRSRNRLFSYNLTKQGLILRQQPVCRAIQRALFLYFLFLFFILSVTETSLILIILMKWRRNLFGIKVTIIIFNDPILF